MTNKKNVLTLINKAILNGIFLNCPMAHPITKSHFKGISLFDIYIWLGKNNRCSTFKLNVTKYSNKKNSNKLSLKVATFLLLFWGVKFTFADLNC